MVAKISIGNSLYGALTYNGEKINKEKGRLLDTNKIYNDGSGTVNIHRAYEDFMRWIPTSSRTERPMMHISLNPHPDDHLSDTDFTRLAHEYMEKMGFAEMPYMIYKHEDIDRHHVHIVALRVGTDGRCITDRNNFYKNKKVCRELEQKYGLKVAEREKITPDMPIRKIDPEGDIKRQVANTVKMVGMRYKFQTIGEYNAVLSLFNVRCDVADGRVNGREYHGLVYFATDADGNTIATPFKASRLGKFAGRDAIEGRFERAKDKIDIAPTKRKVADALAQSGGKDDFVEKLRERNIDVVFRYTDEGRIYGVTFVDHDTMSVLNGSRLGKDYSANALNARFSQGQQASTQQPAPQQSHVPVQPSAPASAPNGNTTQGQGSSASGTSNPSSATQQPQQGSGANNGNSGDFDLSLPGLDLFQPGQSFNPDEEEFRRRKQRKKKKGHRPKF
ncbi:conjugal transfer protein MobB [uncultured Duncaniella sp.]|uniref:conjugal transfer protein MobB n=1 Tax=uncultured Duncaniella sp. TaxID=2768039 RepID=UPI002626BFE6|nr:conjugal transfer protein MobB [uncultured Duncaniella sp.]